MSYKADQLLRRELGAGERLLWAGQPRGGLRLRPADALMIPFSLMWGGFAVFWELSAIRMGAPLLFRLWGIPFVLIGTYIVIGRFFVDAWLRSRTVYGLTNQRVLIISGLASREVKSLPLRTLTEISLRERSDRSGTITFGPSNGLAAWMAGSGWPGTGKAQAAAFEMIDNARAVHEQLRTAQGAPMVEVR